MAVYHRRSESDLGGHRPPLQQPEAIAALLSKAERPFSTEYEVTHSGFLPTTL